SSRTDDAGRSGQADARSGGITRQEKAGNRARSRCTKACNFQSRTPPRGFDASRDSSSQARHEASREARSSREKANSEKDVDEARLKEARGKILDQVEAESRQDHKEKVERGCPAWRSEEHTSELQSP